MIEFWAWILVFNFGFFFFFYLCNYRDQKSILKLLPGSFKDKLKSIYTRPSSDTFRFNLDFLVIILATLLFPALAENKYWFYFSSIFIWMGFIYLIYIAVIYFVFKRIPSIYSDLSFAKVGFLVARGKVIFVVLGLLIVLALTFWGIQKMMVFVFYLTASTTNIVHYPIISLLIFLGIYHAWKFDITTFWHRAVISPTIHFLKNRSTAIGLQKILTKDKKFFVDKNIYADIELKQKPNIFIIAIESYGQVAFDDPYISEGIKAKIGEFETTLSKKGWHVCTNYSEPPIFAGGSWLSYGSFLYGYKFIDNLIYDLLFQTVNNFTNYQSLLHFFRNAGYKNNLVCPIGGYDSKIKWEKIQRVYQYDEKYEFKDLEYSGKTMSYLNFGITPPDGYSINYSYSDIMAKKAEPFLMFFSTLNSHCFYDTPVEVEENWQDYKTKDFATTGKEKSKLIEKYTTAINYQISFINDFIQKNDLKDSIIVLFGDHQPPFIAKEKDGKNTPVHVISKNRQLIDNLILDGFENGLHNRQGKAMKHEGFYSLFMKSFLPLYGKEVKKKLPYFPNGILENQDETAK